MVAREVPFVDDRLGRAGGPVEIDPSGRHLAAKHSRRRRGVVRVAFGLVSVISNEDLVTKINNGNED